MSERVRYSRNDLFGIRNAMENPSHQHHHHHRDGSQKTEAGPNAGGDLAWRRGSDRDEKFRGLRRADMSGSNLEELREKGHPAINDSAGPVAEPLWVYRTAGSSAVSAPTPWAEIQTLIDEELVERDKMEVCRAGDSEYLPYVVALAMRNSRLAPQPVSFDDMEGLICSPKKPSEASTPTWGRRSIDDLHDHQQLPDRQNPNHSGNSYNSHHTPSGSLGSNSHHLEVLHDAAPVDSNAPARGSGAGPRPMMPPMAILPPDPLLPSPTTKNPPAFPTPVPAIVEPEPIPVVTHTPAPIAPPPVAAPASSTPNPSPQANSSATKKQAKEKQQAKENHQATKVESQATKQAAQPAPAVAQPPPKPAPPAWGGKGVAPKGDSVDLEALLAEERRQDQERAKAEAEKALADAAKEKGAASAQGNNKKMSKTELEAQRMLDTKFPSLDSLSMETPPSRKKGK